MEFGWNFICESQRIRTKSKNRCTFHGTYPPVFMVVNLYVEGISTPLLVVARHTKLKESASEQANSA